MIFDKIENMSMYYSTLPELKQVAEFLAQLDAANPPERVEIDGRNLYAMASEYETRLRDEGKYEGHRKYIDVQLLLAGQEQIDILAAKVGQKIDTEYNEDNDALFVGRAPADAILTLTPGLFAVLYPEDLHQPCIAMNDTPSTVKKVVVKIKVK